MNQAPVKGYEKYVGSKVTYRMLNNKWTTVYYEDGVSNTDVPGGTSNLARYLLAQEPSNVTFIVSRATTKQFETFFANRREEKERDEETVAIVLPCGFWSENGVDWIQRF